MILGKAWGSIVVKALLVGRSRDRFPVVSLGIFSVVLPTEPCALRSTQPLKVSTKDFSWGKGGRCLWLMTYQPCSAETSRKSGALIYPEPLGPPRPVAGRLLLLLLLTAIEFSLGAVVLTPVQTKQIRINIHKRNNSKTQYKQYKTK